MCRKNYRTSFSILLCLSIVFFLILKTLFLEKYLEKRNINTISLYNTRIINMDQKQLQLPDCPALPSDLGPYNVEVNEIIEKKVIQNTNLPLGGHSEPENCTALQKIAIVIPFRNRELHLKVWLHNMHPFLQKQQADYGIYVVEQYGELKFNRAKLLNVGYSEAVNEYDYNCFIFTDVDIIPMDHRNLYRCSQNPKHMANSLDKFNFRLRYKTVFGGVVAFSKEQFLKVNGFSNMFWGWGGEDDELYQRVITAGMKIERQSQNISKAKAFLHSRDKGNEQNPKSIRLIKKAAIRMHRDGLNSLNYTIISVTKHRLYTKVTVDIGLPEESID